MNVLQGNSDAADEERLLETFRCELRENVDALEQLVLRFERHGVDEKNLTIFKRICHNMKGAAAAVEQTPLSTAFHQLEDRVEHLAGRLAADPGDFRAADGDQLLLALDHIRALDEGREGSDWSSAVGAGRADPPPASSPTSTQPDHPPQVLVVDDDEEVLQTYRLMLQQLGWMVRTCQDPPKVPAMVDSEVILVMLDLRMPQVDGLTLAREIRSLDPRLMIALHSGALDKQVVVRALNEGVIDYVMEKPLDLEAMRSVTAVARHRSWTANSARLCQEVIRGMFFYYADFCDFIEQRHPDPAQRPMIHAQLISILDQLSAAKRKTKSSA